MGDEGNFFNFKGLLDLDERLMNGVGINLLTENARILLIILSNPNLSMKQVEGRTGLSTGGFYLKVRELKMRGLVLVVQDTHDKRRRCLSVSDLAIEKLLQLERKKFNENYAPHF